MSGSSPTTTEVSYREVGISDSDGKMMTIGSGLREGERVVLNPGMSLVEGTRVRPADMADSK